MYLYVCIYIYIYVDIAHSEPPAAVATAISSGTKNESRHAIA